MIHLASCTASDEVSIDLPKWVPSPPGVRQMLRRDYQFVVGLNPNYLKVKLKEEKKYNVKKEKDSSSGHKIFKTDCAFRKMCDI